MKHHKLRKRKKIVAIQRAIAQSSVSQLPACPRVSIISRGMPASAAFFTMLVNVCLRLRTKITAILRWIQLRKMRLLAWLEQHALELALIVTVISLVVFLGLANWIYLTSPAAVEAQQEYTAYIKQLEAENSTEAGKRAGQRLHRYHGFPGAVIYSPGQTPHYVNAVGRKCRFI